MFSIAVNKLYIMIAVANTTSCLFIERRSPMALAPLEPLIPLAQPP